MLQEIPKEELQARRRKKSLQFFALAGFLFILVLTSTGTKLFSESILDTKTQLTWWFALVSVFILPILIGIALRANKPLEKLAKHMIFGSIIGAIISIAIAVYLGPNHPYAKQFVKILFSIFYITMNGVLLGSVKYRGTDWDTPEDKKIYENKNKPKKLVPIIIGAYILGVIMIESLAPNTVKLGEYIMGGVVITFVIAIGLGISKVQSKT